MRRAFGFSIFIVCFATAAHAAQPPTADRNEDGKPDVFYKYEKGEKARAELDRDFDGKIDGWIVYGPGGKTLRSAIDTNRDGKPDSFKEFPAGGREFVTREDDRNHDGKIDKRSFAQWKPDNHITNYQEGKMQKIPNPAYVTLWREEDNNYDGTIDAYWKRGEKDAKGTVGKPIAPAKKGTA